MRKQDKILKIIWWVYIALLLVFVVVKFKGSFYELTDSPQFPRSAGTPGMPVLSGCGLSVIQIPLLFFFIRPYAVILIHDKNAAYIWADLEIKGLAQHTKDGIVSMGFNGMSYNDNADYKNNWSVLFSENTYKAVFDWLQNNRSSIEEMQVILTGGKEAKKTVQPAPPYGIINIRNSGAGCRKYL